MKVIVVYDDTGRKSEVITDIIGDKGFADVIVKKRRLEEYYQSSIRKIYSDLQWKKVHSAFEYPELVREIELHSEETIRILHCFSNYLISDEEKALLSFKKLDFIKEPYSAKEGKRIAAVLFPDAKSYLFFCKAILSGQKPWDAAKSIKEFFEIDGLVDIGIVGNFVQCVTGNFDSRYFNSLRGNEYTLVKSSSNIKKIKSEYTFYHLLPEDMKYWFVMPFHYQESETEASYTMERLHMTDLAIKWVHGSMDESEFEELLDKYFFFFRSRYSRKCSKEEYERVAKALYIDKVKERITALKRLPEYQKIQTIIEISEETKLDLLVLKYFRLKEKIEAKMNVSYESVIGHGDPCFANALYSKSTKTLKFIDPKGALSEEELWTNQYYDIAKLSHSVCGRYDFFNNALFDIHINDQFLYTLEIPFDPSKYIDIFRRKVEENGFDYLAVRIYAVSLFLSMLPLHIDNPHKVLGFVLNARNILEEIERDV